MEGKSGRIRLFFADHQVEYNVSLKVDCNGKMTWAYTYFSLVLVMKIGMCDLVILRLV